MVIVVGSGSPKRAAAMLTLGHFAASRWQLGDTRLPEVMVSGEGLARTAPDVLATLLHEAAHGLAHARGVKDTSRQGRWHNQHFKTLAEGLGLAIAKDPKIGWSVTAITPTTIAATPTSWSSWPGRCPPTGTSNPSTHPPPQPAATGSRWNAAAPAKSASPTPCTRRGRSSAACATRPSPTPTPTRQTTGRGTRHDPDQRQHDG